MVPQQRVQTVRRASPNVSDRRDTALQQQGQTVRRASPRLVGRPDERFITNAIALAARSPSLKEIRFWLISNNENPVSQRLLWP
jgi:hypothetical protein